ncbi:EIN3-binding F-box protein 1 [Rhizoctonia solani]|uniref:EIN3-binding F-box protein 1 n=1 Tax=Rhizoctonia solani TaxID=456999 RepID=A0A0K6FXH6_9AGAM|nr:EIN3-binding F-box protein 1 [Rhizoctonia solani]
MPKRRANALASARTSSSKRIKFNSFGALNETDDLPPAHVAAKLQSGPSSAGASVRPPRRVNGVPTLVSYAAHIFAAHFRTLFIPESEYLRLDGFAMRKRLSNLPDTLMPRLLLLLREYCPTYLRPEVITTYFLRGREIRLSSDLPGVNTTVINAIGARHNIGVITTLDLARLSGISDQVFAKVVARLPELEKLVLRGCGKAGPLVLEAAASNCPRLKVLNMNYTVATPRSIFSVLLACKELEVLKIAGVPKLVSGCVPLLVKTYIEEHPDDEIPTFTALRSLKIRLTNVSDPDLSTFFQHCPNLTTLDISFTPIKKIPIVSPFPPLKKLSLTSARVSGINLVTVLENSPGLEVLHLGAHGETVGAAPGISNSLTDSLLREITDALDQCLAIRNINLAGNPKLGTGGSLGRALRDFFRRVGRRCEILNFENVPQLHSGDLEGLLCISDDDQPSPLRSLNVARTGVNGDAAMFIAACPKLEVLNLAATKFGREELFTILDCCPDLVKLDLTGCRSISIQDRRRFFEVWESARGDAADSS